MFPSNKKTDDSIQDKLMSSITNPQHPKHWANKEKLKLAKPRAKSARPTCARLRKKSDRPKQAQSTTGRKKTKPMQDMPQTSTPKSK